MEEEWGSMLWSGLGDGRVRVFSLDTLGAEEVYVQAKDRVVRLTLPCNLALVDHREGNDFLRKSM